MKATVVRSTMHVLQLLLKKGLSLQNVTWDFFNDTEMPCRKKVIFFVWSLAHKW